jgi:hypothetical protein
MQSSYTVSEAGPSQEVCVEVLNPPATEELTFSITLIYETRTGTAGECRLLYISAWTSSSKAHARICGDVFLTLPPASSSTPISNNFYDLLHRKSRFYWNRDIWRFIIFPESISTGEPRRSCFNVHITDDVIDENMESFTVILELDIFVMQSGIIVSPNITRRQWWYDKFDIIDLLWSSLSFT